MVTKARISLEEFLAMPETEPPSELWDGEVIQKVAPNFLHGLLVGHIIAALNQYLRGTGEGVVVTEVRYIRRDEERVYLPDINVVLTANIPRSPQELRQGPLELTPDIAIEVLSPGDSASHTLQRADFYMRAGVPLAWFVDPDTESITVYRPGQQPRTHRAPGILDAQPVLRDFRLDLAELFDLPGEPA